MTEGYTKTLKDVYINYVLFKYNNYSKNVVIVKQ